MVQVVLLHMYGCHIAGINDVLHILIITLTITMCT